MNNSLRSNLIELVRGPVLTVWAIPKVAKDLNKAVAFLDDQILAERRLNRQGNSLRAVKALMKRLATYGHEGSRFNNKQFPSEGRHKSGRPNVPDVQLYAFKRDQCRVYGGFIEGLGFLCTGYDGPKKKDEADRDELRRAAKLLAEYM